MRSFFSPVALSFHCSDVATESWRPSRLIRLCGFQGLCRTAQECDAVHVMLPLNGMVVSVGMMSTITPAVLAAVAEFVGEDQIPVVHAQGVGDAILSCLECRDAVVPVGDRAARFWAERHADNAGPCAEAQRFRGKAIGFRCLGFLRQRGGRWAIEPHRAREGMTSTTIFGPRARIAWMR